MLAQFDIILPKTRQIFYLLVAQLSFNARRAAHYERARRNFRVRRDQASGGDKRISADSSAVQNSCADSD